MERTSKEPARKNEFLEREIHGNHSKEMVSYRSKEEPSVANDPKAVVHDLVQELNVKLQSLEDDARAMKETLFRCMKEREMLMKEVTQKFYEIRNSMVDSENAGCLPVEPSSGSCKQDIRKIIGLSEILPQGATSSLVTRDLKINIHSSLNLARAS